MSVEQLLLKVAQQLDDEGRLNEAKAIDSVILRMAKEKEEEEKESTSRNMSGKAKAKFRAVSKACESLCSADLDYRGAHKKECRKVEMLCEEILEALKECSFD